MESEEAVDTDTSLSFLEPLFPVRASRPPPRTPSTRPVLPDVIDSAFLEYTVVVPCSIEKLFKSVESINFIYAVEKGEYILIRDANRTVFRILVAAYGTFHFPPDTAAQLIFITGRQQYRSSLRSAQRREYLASAGNGEQYEAADVPRAQKRRYLEYQLCTGLNIVYIEDACDLHREIKAVATLLNKQHRYTPKVKCRGEGQREEYFRGVLQSVPGISESAAASIHARFPSFGALRRALLEDRGAVANLVVHDAARRNSRILGEKCCGRLADALLSDERNKKI